MDQGIRWILTGAAALALQVGLGALDAQSGDRGVCDYDNLSGDTQAFCDSLAEAPDDLPPVCFNIWISDETQRMCDRVLFAGEPHYYIVDLARNGAVRAIRLIETETGREAATALPYGLDFASQGDEPRQIRIKFEDIKDFVEGRPTPGSSIARGSSRSNTYGTGLPIGWNNSSGPTPGECFNYTFAPLGDQITEADFDNTDTASSTSEQINASATVKTSFDLFTVKDTATFSEQWSASSFSDNEYYNIFGLYALDVALDTSNPLNAQGTAAGDSFGALCGTRYMAAVPAGMVATISVSYGSSSQSTQTEVSDQVQVDEGLTSVSAGVSVANSANESSSYFEFSLISYGGGTTAATDLTNAFGTTDPQNPNEAFYVECGAGDVDACNSFTTSMSTGAEDAFSSFDALVTAVNSQTSNDLSFLYTFPNGVAGANVSPVVTAPIMISNEEDVLEPYSSQLKTYVTLVNQIGNLSNRAGNINGLFNQNPLFNPEDILNLSAIAETLQDRYLPDRNTLLDDLKQCLCVDSTVACPTSSTVTSVCAPIIDNMSENAFDFYGNSNVENAFQYQQNTVALQYTATQNFSGGAAQNVFDVLYLSSLPTETGSELEGQAALVGFQDRVVVSGASSNGEILALEPGQPISTNNVSQNVRQGTDPAPFTIYQIGGGQSPELFPFTGATFTGGLGPCTPTIDDPCLFDYSYVIDPDTVGMQDVTTDYQPIQEFFGEPGEN